MEPASATSHLLGFYTDEYALRAPNVSELYKQLGVFSPSLGTEKVGQLRLEIEDGQIAVGAADWQKAAQHLEQFIRDIQGVKHVVPLSVHTWVFFWAAVNILPIYHFHLKLYKECINTLDTMLNGYALSQQVLDVLVWCRRAMFYEWGHKLLETEERVEQGQKLIRTALEPVDIRGVRFSTTMSESEAQYKLCHDVLCCLYCRRSQYGEAQRWNSMAQNLAEENCLGAKCETETLEIKAMLLYRVGSYTRCEQEALSLKADLESSNSYLEATSLCEFLASRINVLLLLRQCRYWDRKVADPEVDRKELMLLLQQFEEASRGHPVFEGRLYMEIALEHASELYSANKPFEALACLGEVYEGKYREMLTRGTDYFNTYPCLKALAECHHRLYKEDQDINHYVFLVRYYEEALSSSTLTIRDRAEVYSRLGEMAALVPLIHVRTTGTSVSNLPFEKPAKYLRNAAALYSQILFDLKTDNETWTEVMEEDSHKKVFYRLQREILVKLERRGLFRYSQQLRSVKESILSDEDPGFARDSMKEALIWAERGRTRALMNQIGHGVLSQQAARSLLSFDHDDEVAWNYLRKSVSDCGSGTTFVVYSCDTGNASIIAYVLTEDGVVDMRLWGFEGLKEYLMETLKKIHAAMSDVSTFLRKKGEIMRDLENLHHVFIMPIADLLASMKPDQKLVFSGSEMFSTIPFAILRGRRHNSNTIRYLFEHHTISVTPSLRVLGHCKDRLAALEKLPLIQGKPGAGVVVGDPAYLPYSHRIACTRTEANEIAGLFGADTVVNIQGIDATVEAVMNLAEMPGRDSCRQGFLHFAVHGQGGDDSKSAECKKGALELANPAVKSWPPPSHSQSTGISAFQQTSTPPTSSDGNSLELEGSTQFQEAHSTAVVAEQSFGEVGGVVRRDCRGRKPSRTGILSSEAIVKSGFEWRSNIVVMSACDTARGKVLAEGVMNLTRAFLVVGIPCTVVSQWKVVDSFAPSFMKELYLNLRKGADVASALRQAMLTFVNKEEVYKWGAFIVCGFPNVQLPRELWQSI